LPTDKPYIRYRELAEHLSQLPLNADCAALALHMQSFPEALRLLDTLKPLSPSASWFVGLREFAEILKMENPRFDIGLFEDWASERY